MERFDFSGIIKIVEELISDDYEINQSTLIDEVFYSFFFLNDTDIVSFDNALICRWINGQAKVSPKIIKYYREKENKLYLKEDIRNNIFPLICDRCRAIENVYKLLLEDDTISREKKLELGKNYPFYTESEAAEFLANGLFYGMEREFVKRDKNNKNIQVRDNNLQKIPKLILDSFVPMPCKYFCGREQEICKLHEKILKYKKIFLMGMAGIGKSEVVKAYAKEYKDNYENIIYIPYSKDLKTHITKMNFLNDEMYDSDEIRFKRHNDYLKNLTYSDLIIIDNINISVTDDAFLKAILNYECCIIFTSRNTFPNYECLEIKEIEDKNKLVNIVNNFYLDARDNYPVIDALIEKVHCHTFAVELIAKLLQNGLWQPEELLEKLKKEKFFLSSTDKIKMLKDGEIYEYDYYTHIHILFSLYMLPFKELNIIKHLSLMPEKGIDVRFFALWMGMDNLNLINKLVEKGIVYRERKKVIKMHPMIREIVLDESKPSVNSCNTMLSNIKDMCINCLEENIFSYELFGVINSIIDCIVIDDKEKFREFLKSVFPYIETEKMKK